MAKWLDWAVELQSIAQIGLTYTKDKYDVERFQRIRDLSAEIISEYTDVDIDKVKDLFCKENGYPTPKLDTRAAIFEDDKILLVKENGLWSLPGGWVEVQLSIKENIIKEVKEETGLDVEPLKIVAILDRKKHYDKIALNSICRIIILCQSVSGKFVENIETDASEYFSLNNLPELDSMKTTLKQIEMCFEVKNNPSMQTIFD